MNQVLVWSVKKKTSLAHAYSDVYRFFCSVSFHSVEIHFGHQDDDRETHMNIKFFPLMSISFSIPFHSIEIHFGDQDYDRETHLNIKFIPLMSIGFAVPFHSIPLRIILDIKMMIEKHT